ncbi:MAG TPA: M28 family peptidase [Thermoanaerobaculia bacterium]|nr:M28 family peptidase [Thermoanaerobaculia bacterium]
MARMTGGMESGWAKFSALMVAGVALVVSFEAVGAVAGKGKGGGAGKTMKGVEGAAREIRRETLEAPIRFLADDLLEGRGPGTRADRLSRLYLQSVVQMIGLQPGGPEGGWQQPFDIVGVKAAVPDEWRFEGAGKAVTLKRWDDFIASSGVQNERAAIEGAELVFVGHGIQAPEYRWDDFKGADLKGKVLVMLNHNPESFAPGKRRLYYGRWTYKYESAARQGAAAAIIIHTTPSAGYPWQVVQTSWSGEKFSLPRSGEPEIQITAWTTDKAMRQLLAAAGQDLDQLVKRAQERDFRPQPLGIKTSLALTNKVSRVQTANVLGLLPGSDPKLRDEVVVYSAHHDHLGIGEPDKSGDRIYHGAVDNASGCAQVLAIARAFAALPERPRRSILFLLVGVEEQGLLGSEYYAKHPTFPPGRIAANINYDGGNIWGRARDVTSIALGKSSLDPVVAALAARQGRTVVGDQFPDRGHFYRSDQFNFAKIGVPALYLNTGTDFRGRPSGWGKEQLETWEATRYHQPSDRITPDWTFEGMIEDAQLGFATGIAVAQADAFPTWNHGDEFEAARKAALAEAAKAGH